jgi:hypothetical protein
MATDLGLEACVLRSPLDHRQDLVSVEAAVGELPAAIKGPEEGSLPLCSDPRSIEIGAHVGLGVVVGRDLMPLAAYLVQPEPHSRASDYPQVVVIGVTPGRVAGGFAIVRRKR